MLYRMLFAPSSLSLFTGEAHILTGSYKIGGRPSPHPWYRNGRLSL